MKPQTLAEKLELMEKANEKNIKKKICSSGVEYVYDLPDAFELTVIMGDYYEALREMHEMGNDIEPTSKQFKILKTLTEQLITLSLTSPRIGTDEGEITFDKIPKPDRAELMADLLDKIGVSNQQLNKIEKFRTDRPRKSGKPVKRAGKKATPRTNKERDENIPLRPPTV